MKTAKETFKEEYSKNRRINRSYGETYVRNGGLTTFKKYLPEAKRNSEAAKNAAYLCALTPLHIESISGIYSRISEVRKDIKESGLEWLLGISGLATDIAAAKQYLRWHP